MYKKVYNVFTATICVAREHVSKAFPQEGVIQGGHLEEGDIENKQVCMPNLKD